jgi:phosphoadenosine phosphosulfate reductase
VTLAELNAIFETTGLPRHTLEATGFSSVGCVPCTSRSLSGASSRAGRWSGLAKTECGIHTGPLTAQTTV